MDATEMGQSLAVQIFMSRLLVQTAGMTTNPAKYIESERALLVQQARDLDFSSADADTANLIRKAVIRHLEETFALAAMAGTGGELRSAQEISAPAAPQGPTPRMGEP